MESVNRAIVGLWASTDVPVHRRDARVGGELAISLCKRFAVLTGILRPSNEMERACSRSKKNQRLGPLAQLVEQLTLNQLVVGSIPTRPTISLKNKKFFDPSRKKLKTLPHRSEFPPFNSQHPVDLVLFIGKKRR